MADVFDLSGKSFSEAVKLFPVNISDVSVKYVPTYGSRYTL